MSRRAIARLLDAAEVLRVLLAARSRFGSPWLAVLTYHRAAKVGGDYVFDPGVVDVTPEELDWQLGFVKEWFSVVDLEALRGFVHGKSLPRNPVHITFDDGYKDNFSTILPILKKHDAPATFFVATDYIENRRLFWWDRVHYIFKTTRKDRLTLTYPGPMVLDVAAARDRAIQAAIRVVKYCYDLDIERFLGELADAAGVTLDRSTERALADEQLMTWDEIRELQAAGMAIQSHTVTHRVLDTLPDKRLREELAVSREVIEGKLRTPVRSIAYPVTLSIGQNPSVRRALQDTGYDLGFTTGDGVNLRKGFDPLDVKRLAPEVGLTHAHFGAMLAVPHFAP
jgi:peptidoglycan/xylan/chitin deacetylase (PgdA/CDA1 family)